MATLEELWGPLMGHQAAARSPLDALATHFVGDGGSPNMFFVTQVMGQMEGTTACIAVTLDKGAALDIAGRRTGKLLIEDRKNGEVWGNRAYYDTQRADDPEDHTFHLGPAHVASLEQEWGPPLKVAMDEAQLEEIVGGPDKAFKLMNLWETAKQTVSGDRHRMNPRQRHPAEVFPQIAKDYGFTPAAIRAYINYIT
jgi:hypothetical protein